MKAINFFGLIFLLTFSSNLFCESQSIHLNYTIFVDNEFAQYAYSGDFKIKDSFGNTTDSIQFRYEAGELTLDSLGYQKLVQLKPNSQVQFDLNIRKSLVYSIRIDRSKLIQRYVIFKIYNFENKENHKYFIERKGYGIDIFSPAGSITLLRKRFDPRINNAW